MIVRNMTPTIAYESTITDKMLAYVANSPTKAFVAYPYARAIHSSEDGRAVDWQAINEAIAARWSMAALLDIKTWALAVCATRRACDDLWLLGDHEESQL